MKKKGTSIVWANVLFCGGVIAVAVSVCAMGWPSMLLTAGLTAAAIAYKRA